MPVLAPACPGRHRRDRRRRPRDGADRRPVRCSSAPVSSSPTTTSSELVDADRGLAGWALPRGVGDERWSPHVESSFTFTGDDRFIGDYLRSEFLDRVSRADVSFLTRTSILDRMSGPLCDVDGRAHRIEPSARSAGAAQPPGHPAGSPRRVVPLSPSLPRAAARRADAARTGDGPASSTSAPRRGTRRTACRRRPSSMPSTAGDAERVARLVLKVANPVWASGRLDTVLRWMEWFSANELIETQPAVAVHGASDLRAHRQGRATPSGGRAAARTDDVRRDPRRREHDGGHARLPAGAALPRRRGRDAPRRADGAGGAQPDSPYRAAMLHAEGAARTCSTVTSTGPTCYFARAVDEATSAGVVPFIPRRSWPSAASSPSSATTGRGRGARRHRRWRSCRTAASTTTGRVRLVYAWAARVASHRGDLTSARDLAARAARLRPLLTYALPVVSVQALLELARAYIALGDPGGARAALRQIQDILQHRPGLGDLPRAGRTSCAPSSRRSRARCSGVSSLTTAELRLLPLLPDPSLAGGDQRAAVRLAEHGQDAGDLDLPQVRRVESRRDDQPHARARSGRPPRRTSPTIDADDGRSVHEWMKTLGTAASVSEWIR